MPSVPLGSAPQLAGCLGPDIRCDIQDGAGDVVDAVAIDIDLPDPGDLIDNPLDHLGDAITKAAADAWTAAMLAVWNAGLFVLRVVLNFADSFLTPDLSEGGPGRDVYAYTAWIGGALVLIMAMIQLAIAAFRRDGKSLATMLIGTGQFVVVWSAWVGYCVVVVTACGGLTRALMKALLGVDSWPEWDPWKDFSSADVTDATVATVLGLLGMVLWIAAIGHLLVLLTRAAALIVLAATGAICAAGLVSDAGRSWFWKSLRWFHAAALTPVIMVLVLGIGVQLATGVASGLTDTTQQAVGTALPAVVLICISCVAPLALFKLLAFVDPGTPSGASVRAGLAGVGGIQGLLSGSGAASGGGAGGGSGSNVAAQTDSSGRSAGESGAEEDTSSRFTKSAAGVMSALGPVGGALGAGAGMVANIGAEGCCGRRRRVQPDGCGPQRLPARLQRHPQQPRPIRLQRLQRSAPAPQRRGHARWRRSGTRPSRGVRACRAGRLPRCTRPVHLGPHPGDRRWCPGRRGGARAGGRPRRGRRPGRGWSSQGRRARWRRGRGRRWRCRRRCRSRRRRPARARLRPHPLAGTTPDTASTTNAPDEHQTRQRDQEGGPE